MKLSGIIKILKEELLSEVTTRKLIKDFKIGEYAHGGIIRVIMDRYSYSAKVQVIDWDISKGSRRGDIKRSDIDKMEVIDEMEFDEKDIESGKIRDWVAKESTSYYGDHIQEYVENALNLKNKSLEEKKTDRELDKAIRTGKCPKCGKKVLSAPQQGEYSDVYYCSDKKNCGWSKETSQLKTESFIYEKKSEKAPSKKPPKEWFKKMIRGIKNKEEDYSKKQIVKTVSDIWYHKLTDIKRSEIRKRYGKTYKF